MATTFSKRAGEPVFPAHAGSKHLAADAPSLLDRVLAAAPWRADIAWPAGFEGGLAHRLDNATSGAVVCADSIEELARLRAWFSARALRKTYWLLAARDPPWDEHLCETPLAHHPKRKARMVPRRGANTPHRGAWLDASTEFERREGSLVFIARMRTGVMHQIRVHAALCGIPIVGDSLYGGGRTDDGLFCLHHAGLEGPDGFASDPVPPPAWASAE